MSSLKAIIKDEYNFICEGIAWVVVYKNGRNWDSWRLYEEDGNYDDGYIFSKEDLDRMKDILQEDSKAICINGNYTGFAEDFTMKEMENKVLWMYTEGFNQLYDFLKDFVIK